MYNSTALLLFTILYTRFQNCAKDMSTVTAQLTILESGLKLYKMLNTV